ncbi:extracellular solute-binding protein [Paenibacillus sp. PAMC21692]|uniref:extracellular solute-binding protein n=1 Tax=Paenibacillus sp. PAMC21692 TaxID=2762320 RepID=UPI00164E1773|nr:extracellular solute-binding protein [Paenibacillus sp. PAMC21692]QNK56295.1 extracellular solute-binding protein [Paenibacillus sp. PAMC21692]
MKRENEFRYMELAGILRSQILSGFIKSGEYLLSENDLCQKYGMSRTSVRKSLNELLGEGLIVKMAGKGTIVSPNLVVPEGEEQTLLIASPFPSAYSDRALPRLIQMFQERYPGVTIRVLSVPLGANTVLEDIRGLGVEVDLMIILDSSFPAIYLDDFYPLEEKIFENIDIPRKLLQAFTHQQQVYAAPLTYSPIFLAYNPELFRQNGVECPKSTWSLAELVEAAKRLTKDNDDDGLVDIYGLALSSSINRWLALALNQGVRFSTDDPGGFNTDLLVRFLSFFQNLFYRDKVSPIYALSDQDFAQRLFEEGRIGMILTTTLSLSSPNYVFKPQVAHFPDNSNSCGLMIANGMLMSRSSTNPELAKLFIQFTLEPKVQLSLAQETGLLSIYNSVNRQTRDANEIEALQLHDDRMDRYLFINDVFENMEIVNEVNEEMRMYWAGMERPETVVERLKTIIVKNDGSN